MEGLTLSFDPTTTVVALSVENYNGQGMPPSAKHKEGKR
jgi:hypothetical protein